MSEMSHYVYKITDRDTGEYYYGKRSCHGSWRDDKYMGSGTLLLNKMSAHPDHDWHKEVLLLLDSEEEAYEYEAVVIGDKWFGGDSYDGKCLNLVPGGIGATSEIVAKRWEDPDYKERVCASMKEAASTDEAKERAARLARERWQDPEYKKRVGSTLKEVWRDEGLRELVSQVTKSRWEDPEYRERTQTSMREALAAPEERARRSAASKKHWATPGARERQARRVRKPVCLVLRGAQVEVGHYDTASLMAYLRMGAEFEGDYVHLHNDNLQARLHTHKKAAKRVLLLDSGWCYGKRAGYPKKGLKELGLSDYSK